MRVLLVNMPWAPIDLPSLALGILKRSVDERVPNGTAEVLHANIEYVDWITENTEFTLEDYSYYALGSYFLGCGDWVFSSALYDDPQWRVGEFTEAMSNRVRGARMEMTQALHVTAPDFVRHIAERIVELAPDVVGFTSTFQQNTAALAAAKHVKRLAPHIVTAMGGANCDGKQGESVHRNFPFVDHVVRGEGEVSFPALLTALDTGAPLAEVPGLCWRDADGTSVANTMSTRPLPPASILPPDYAGYFERLAASRARHWVEPKLVVEGARGCWWGEKHHCTFCGLNGSFMQFRSKSPTVFFDEIVELAARHRVLDMYVVDNILDMGYVRTVLPRIIDSGYDLRMHIEIKSNMRRGQLQTLADAGLIFVQPGIESLNSRVLTLMDKGVSGGQNVRMLRDAATVGLSVAWNYLHGFPGESAEDYDDVVAQLPALEHLNPPVGASSRIAIERFSPYFNDPGLGFSELRPAEPYRLTYDLPEAEMFDLAYVFDVPPRGIDEETVRRLDEGITRWKRNYPGSRLTHCDLEDRIVLVSSRRSFAWTRTELTDPLELALFRLLDQPHTVRAAARKLGEEHAVGEDALRRVLARWRSLGLVFEDNGQFVQIAPPAVNEEFLRIDFMRHTAARADDLAVASA
ncbi:MULTISPECIES: RiPP maturation radical SAM C-methyltransferase [Streptomyces]|uniref:RiPP maturation radical SAM C-methyltransferase n=1 Tax=Streptomyces doudnae TaxID=3075536 RepID=A0ABD5EVB7_9ACTN|nr:MULTISPECIES: RiPP maturation radical SAM C-methyltransferase [unclassified Streptomyces]MDT0438304.1 RiPP maturation radical SAM C-methyltransferase [Streptomyces sp. DSM 41981]MYQ65171.1 RiPP maturation radical SAM protein 1 [Streptomyces sp. SID4950]SCD94229.1 ribosomal peptide maturation radical SAM protein 1 [Streptomyces sp. SolWspMP-5a-2]